MAVQLPDMINETDVSLVGWGAQHQGCRTGGQWSTEEKQMHITQDWIGDSSRSPGRNHRCIHPGLESVSGICESSVVLNFESITQNTKGGSQDIVNCFSVEDPTMVSSIVAAVGQDPSFATHGNGSISSTQKGFIMPMKVPQLAA